MLFEKPAVEKQSKKTTGEVLSRAAAQKAGPANNQGEGREIFDTPRLNPKNNHLPKLLAKMLERRV